jgi:hypothetical protein
MIRFAWLQSQTAMILAAAAVLLIAVVAAITGPSIAHLYDTTIAGCIAHGTCSPSQLQNVVTDHHRLREWLGLIVVAVPGVIGVFWGAPLLARELESGTFRLVWTQSVTRTRWLAVRMAVLGLAGVALAGLLSLIVTLWAQPLDRAAQNVWGSFEQRDVVPLAYATFAFTVGVAAGTLVRRMLPAMVSALAGFIAVRVLVTQELRPHLLSPLHESLPLSAGDGLGFASSGSGPIELMAGDATVPNGWVYSTQIVGRSGHAASAWALHSFVARHCSSIAISPALHPGGSHSTVATPGASQQAFNACLNTAARQFHLLVAYQPGSRFWLFQGLEAGIYVAAAAALAAGCWWFVRRRLT